MESLRIERLEARYHLTPSQRGQRRRLDRVLGRTLDEVIGLAVERAGVPPWEELLIRRLHVPVRLRLAASDEALMLGWGEALAAAIRQARDRGDTVRYGSRREALLDFARGAAAGRLERAWAWRRLGFGPIAAGDSRRRAARLLGRALAREGGAVVPVLAALARHRRIAPVARHWEARQWQALARAALEAAGVAAEPELARAAATIAAVAHPLRRRARRALAASPLGRPFAVLARALPAAERPAVTPALAALALLASEPALARRGGETHRLLAAAAEVLARAGAAPEDEAEEGAPAPRVETKKPGAPGPPSAGAAEAPSDDDAAPEQAAEDRRQRGRTEHGGLLYLVAALDDLGLPHEMAGAELFRRRPWRWLLHRFALELLPLAGDDPAALALAGLGPEETPPSLAEEPATAAELAAIARWRRRLAAALGERLGWPELAPPALLDRLCRRRAEIVADPGWIEVHLSLDDVSTAVRRAGLDLDPGFVPWLGVVLRFVYA